MNEKRINCEALISGEWYLIPVERLRGHQNHEIILRRCPECKAKIRLMKEGRDGQKAHFEHHRRNSSCSESVAHGKHEKYGDYEHSYVREKQVELDISYKYKDLLKYALSSSDKISVNIETDIEDILNNDSIGTTEKSVLINARIGQGKFRKILLNYWGKCSVTGVSDPVMLLASHIKPWSICTDSERLDCFNGLLLSPNLDRAFDQGLISFSDAGTILISPNFEFPEKLGVNNEMKIELKAEHLLYMSYHRKNVYQNT